MTPYYQDDACTIYHGDCRDVLPQLGRFDLLLTDIPYAEVNRKSGGLRNLNKGDADVATFDVQWLVGSASIAAVTSYVWCGIEQVSGIRKGFVSHGLTTRLCIWEKTNPSPMNGERLWLSSVECCVFARSGGAHFDRKCASPVWRCPVERNQVHPTQKPVSLFREIISASCPIGGLVVDTCLGSGTTLVAAKLEGRRAVGIELNEKYCEIAANRLAQGVLF